ncbi:MAG: ATP-binding protein [Bryobacteraceae bacterium]
MSLGKGRNAKAIFQDLVSCTYKASRRTCPDSFSSSWDNAPKYTDQGVIDITVALERSKLRIAISDTGIGIGPAALPHLFERFWRADKVRSRAEGGDGLRLAVAAQIVHRIMER